MCTIVQNVRRPPALCDCARGGPIHRSPSYHPNHCFCITCIKCITTQAHMHSLKSLLSNHLRSRKALKISDTKKCVDMHNRAPGDLPPAAQVPLNPAHFSAER
jgi:hypothetical protein